jgi:hypothetical protein
MSRRAPKTLATTVCALTAPSSVGIPACAHTATPRTLPMPMPSHSPITLTPAPARTALGSIGIPACALTAAPRTLPTPSHRPLPAFTARLLSATWLVTIILLVTLTLTPSATRAQTKPTLTVDDDIPVFSIAPDGRVVYAVRHLFKFQHYDLQRDDIWILDPGGHKSRILNGQKQIKPLERFSYAVQSFAWAPDSRRFIAQMATTEVTDAEGSIKWGETADLMDSGGQEISVAGANTFGIPDAYQATWLADGATVAYLTEIIKPKALFAINLVRPAVGGAAAPILAPHTFSAVAWDARRNAAVAIERNANLGGPFLLVWLDLVKQTRRQLAILDGFAGQLTISPSGDRVAYFRDGDTLEVRSVVAPDKAAQIRVSLGRYEWDPREQRILIKRGSEHRSGDLLWISIPAGETAPALHGLAFREFHISPSGDSLGVLDPGRSGFQIFSLPQ